MSFDPFGQEQPPPEQPAAESVARSRVLIPGILLILVSVLNLLAGGYFLVNGMYLNSLSDEEFEKIMRSRQNEKQFEDMEKAGYTMPQLKRMSVQGCIGYAVTQGVVILIGLVGGIRMLQLKSYGLCIFASIVTAIPCLSASGCCCIGEVAGIWALIVLISEEVRTAFR